MSELKFLKDLNIAPTLPVAHRKEVVSGSDVRWCPGCGDYSILSQVQGVIPKLGVPREKIVFISGIGCSSRFPYYMNTYGFHSIHGRALTLATGLKCSRPDLSIWVVTGDGDGLSIGGNHMLHALRRNVDINILLFNNRIYGLTKGQYSPTSQLGHRTKSTPDGSIDYPLNPISVALASECTFVARSVDTFPKHLEETVERAARHKGASFVEIFQNCNIFNDEAFEHFTGRDVRAEKTISLEHGKPMIFGANKDKGLRMTGPQLEIIDIKTDADRASVLVHDEKNPNPAVAYFLGRMDPPDFPMALGVLRSVDRPTYDAQMSEQIAAAEAKRKPDLQALVTGNETWVVQ